MQSDDALHAAITATGDPDEPHPLPDPIDEQTEVIGGMLWTAFAAGASPCEIPDAVVRLAREKSRGWIRHNIEKGGYASFPIERTRKCARSCGVRAAALSLPAEEITLHAFETAWNDEQKWVFNALDRARRVAEHLGRPPRGPATGGACS